MGLKTAPLANKIVSILIVATIFVLLAFGAYCFRNTTIVFLPEKPTPANTSVVDHNPTAELNHYQNTTYGFQLSLPENFEVITESEYLLDYPNSITLVYSGGQTHDVIIDLWENESDYMSYYSSRLSDVTVLQSAGKYITFLDNNLGEQNKQIISSAKILVE